MAKDTKPTTRIPKATPEPKNPDAPRPDWGYLIKEGKTGKIQKN